MGVSRGSKEDREMTILTRTGKKLRCIVAADPVERKPDRLDVFRQFVGPAQRAALYDAIGGEEGKFFGEKIAEVMHFVETMPKTYEQESMGGAALVYLHYFRGGQDWFITERDQEHEQLQAFGLADIFGDGGELGYISIAAVLAAGAELDLYWKVKTLDEVRAGRGLGRWRD